MDPKLVSVCALCLYREGFTQQELYCTYKSKQNSWRSCSSDVIVVGLDGVFLDVLSSSISCGKVSRIILFSICSQMAGFDIFPIHVRWRVEICK